VVIGFSTPPDITPAIDDNVQSFLSADEALL
jgi:hypothetical protein